MRVVASERAVELIGERGGKLYVWVTRSKCCNGLQTLRTATETPSHTTFARSEAGTGFELFLPAALGRLPDELHVDAGRFSRRVEAYWDGCAWVS